MSLYDDIDTDSKKTDANVAGWASGIKFLQSHMQLKKAAVTLPKRDMTRKNPTSTLTPVIDLNFKSNAKNNNADPNKAEGDSDARPGQFGVPLPFSMILPKETKKHKNSNRIISSYLSVDPEWQFDNEYDPIWPNDYDKALKELRERRDREAEEDEKRRRSEDDMKDKDDDRKSSKSRFSERGGAQIAPPPSLSQPSIADDKVESAPNFSAGGGGISAAARIMAKYGYREGQGLGKKEQGMSTALQVEKTSHRIGRIIHEKDVQREISIPNPFGLVSSMAAYNDIDDDDEDGQMQIPNEDQTGIVTVQEPEKEKEPTLAEILKNPSNVVLLKNMVGPGEVDDDLEPEVKDECNTKYGEVRNVTVFQMPDMDGDDAIRIFVEFSAVDSAVKAFMDLNGRFFGGRQVKASFYDFEKYNNLELID